MINNPYKKKSEIINQKKDFIFNVEQTSNHVFPNEEYTYFIYIKNISGVDIEDFSISIKHPKEVDFVEKPKVGMKNILLKNDEVKLYEMKAYCKTKGEHIVNFFGYGKGTEILAKTLKIKCTTTYNSDKLIHRIHIYDFTPYEENYTLEADDYNEDVIQIFKNQKLPYKAGEQPFPMESDFKPPFKERDPHAHMENKESQSFLDQYKEARNINNQAKEHVYQYISRENFTEDSIEQYTGENLQELIEKINNNSSYFRGTFLGSGNNHLLNDFTQYAPNGFLHRMGLLTSEIYHLLGVVPTYGYMSDYLFRWAPHPSGQHLIATNLTESGFRGDETNLLDLYPKQEAMLWDKNIWAGTGWIVYKIPTEEYKKTKEYKTLLEENSISIKEKLELFDEEDTAKEFVRKQESIDKEESARKGETITKYEYSIEQSLYDTGVFFINIPINKIPKNFYILDTDVLYPIIERVKPYGTKPIINYIVEENFQLDMKQKFIPNYYETQEFIHNDIIMGLDAAKYKIMSTEKTCNGVKYPVIEKTFVNRYLDFPIPFNHDITLNVEPDDLKIRFKDNELSLNIDENLYGVCAEKDIEIKTFADICKILYNNNYNNISFYISPSSFFTLNTKTLVKEITEENGEYNIIIDEKPGKEVVKRSFDGIKVEHTPGLPEDIYITFKDKFNNKYQLISEYNKDNKLTYIKYKTINSKQKEHINKEGAIENPESIGFKFIKIDNKYLVVFFVEKNHLLHYFTHTIVTSLEELEFYGTNPRILQKIGYSHETSSNKITLNTPIIYNCLRLQPSSIRNGKNWNNLYRFNTEQNTYTYCNNKEQTEFTPDNILLDYDNIDIPKTSLIKQTRFKLIGAGKKNNKIYLYNALNTNHLVEESNGNILEKRPTKIETYKQSNESTECYRIQLESAKTKNQTKYIKEFEKLLNENIVFNENIDIKIPDSLKSPNDFIISINKTYWCELLDFEFPPYSLNNVQEINLIIEGYNENQDIPIIAQILSETNYASEVKDIIPCGYFYKEIPLLYPNGFSLEDIRARFKFNDVLNDVKIFNTSLKVEFKNKQSNNLELEFVDEQQCSQEMIFEISKEYDYPSDFNNGLTLEMQFDDLFSGAYYHLNTSELEILYQETSIDFIANGNYQNTPMGVFTSVITGTQQNAYLKGEFYDDYETISQIQSNINSKNKGIKLQNEIYQSFVAKDDNITAIEIYPNGFVGQPDELLRIGLYSNHGNTPDNLIKEIFGSGWIKNNESLKNKNSIKYNMNVNNLIPGKTYWIKFKVENPQDNSYYRLKGIDETLPQYRLLSNENNNYINTLSCLKFNIYSRNIVKSFNHIPAIQEILDNPNILIGLNKGQGVINNLSINKYNSTIIGENSMQTAFGTNDDDGKEKMTQTVKYIVNGKTYTTEGKEYTEGENND